ncbi:MAG: hypothetical protein OXU19_12370 [bacterium]|nr:hypothetical protein [bacterium]MDE0239992.1 hypothetical protein [bacterium]
MINAVIFDWSGNVLDFGSTSPMETFADRDDEARGLVDLGKRQRIEALAQMRRIAVAWRHVHGQDITGRLAAGHTPHDDRENGR